MSHYKIRTKDANTIQITQININTNNITQQSIKQIVLKLRETSFVYLQTQTLFQKPDHFTKICASLRTKFTAVSKQAEEQLFPHAENKSRIPRELVTLDKL
jgi:hypothetical protein